MVELSINLGAILTWGTPIGYFLAKCLCAHYISRQEFQYPIWDKEGVQTPRMPHHKVRAYIRNFLVNPELVVIKAITFPSVFLITGMRHWDMFKPWKIQKAPPICDNCNDTGWYHSSGSFGNNRTTTKCKCRPLSTNALNCKVCLGQGHIWRGRACPHCEHRHKTWCQRTDEFTRDMRAENAHLAGDTKLCCDKCGSENSMGMMVDCGNHHEYHCLPCVRKTAVSVTNKAGEITFLCKKCNKWGKEGSIDAHGKYLCLECDHLQRGKGRNPYIRQCRHCGVKGRNHHIVDGRYYCTNCRDGGKTYRPKDPHDYHRKWGLKAEMTNEDLDFRKKREIVYKCNFCGKKGKTGYLQSIKYPGIMYCEKCSRGFRAKEMDGIKESQ